MRINDVWRNIGKEIGVFVKGQFDFVPMSPGVYAWFYPLRVTSLNLEQLLGELSDVFNYDAELEATPKHSSIVPFTWNVIKLEVEQSKKDLIINDQLKKIWQDVISSPELFLELRKALMRASILMPPLYVGKTNCLHSRCSQHLNDTRDGTFHSRFERYASTRGFSSSKISDLIFACITTDSTGEDNETEINAHTDLEILLEAIMKFVSAPSYGIR